MPKSAFTFKFVPAEDSSVDAEYQLLRDGKATPFSVQVGEDGVNAVTEYGDTWIKFHGESRSIEKAKALAIKAAA